MPAAEHTGALRVVLVEDNPVIRDLLVHGVRRLEQQIDDCPPIEITEAEDGATAWERIEDDPPHLLVVDLYLPVLGGLDLIKRVRDTEATANTRILAMSASFSDARDRAIGAGADQFLQKPLRLVDVLDALSSLLRQHL